MKRFTVYAILILAATSTLFRGLLFGFETYGFLAVISLLSFFYFFSKVRNNEAIYINKIYSILCTLLIAAYAMASLRAVNPRANIASILLYTTLAMAFHVWVDYFYDKKRQLFKEIMWMVVATGFVCAMIGLEAITHHFGFLDVTLFYRRLGSAFQYANTAAIYLSVCILFALALMNTSMNPVLKALLAGTGAIFILALFMTISRGGWLVGTVVLIVFLVIQPSGAKISSLFSFASMMISFALSFNKFELYAKAHDFVHATLWIVIPFLMAAALQLAFLMIGWLYKKYILKGNELLFHKGIAFLYPAAFVAAAAFVLIFWQQFISILPPTLGNRFKNLNLNDSNILHRIEFDKDALKLIAVNWITGLGGGGWQTRHQSIQNVFYEVTFIHNNYLQIFVESGILGFISYLSLMTASFINLLAAFIKTADKNYKTAISGILCSFAAVAVHSFFDFDLSYVSLSLLLWIMFSMAAVKTDIGKCTFKMDYMIHNRYVKTVPIFVCGFLISIYSLYFTGAYNANRAIKYVNSGDYRQAMLFYQEAARLDPLNSEYTSELANLYCFFADKTCDNEERKMWLDKAIVAGEQCINCNRYYPTYVKILIRIYKSANITEKVLFYSNILVDNQRCFGNNYEVLAKAYLDMGNHFIIENNTEKARQMFKACIAVANDPNLTRARTGISLKLAERNKSDAKPGKDLEKYINNARELLREKNGVQLR